MDLLRPIALIVAGLLAASGFIIERKPNARQLMDKLMRFQGVIGVALLIWGVIDAWRAFGNRVALGTIGTTYPLYSLSVYAAVAAEVLLGLLLGLPMITAWMPGDTALEQRALEIRQKIVPYQTLLGLLSIVVAGIQLFYYQKFH